MSSISQFAKVFTFLAFLLIYIYVFQILKIMPTVDYLKDHATFKSVSFTNKLYIN